MDCAMFTQQKIGRVNILTPAEHVPNRKAKQIAHSLRKIVNLYARGSYRVRTVMMDMEFEKVKDEKGMELVDVNTTAAREHVGEIERGIRYLKERSRCSVSTFAVAGIKFLAKTIVIQLVYNVTMFVNAVLDALGVSEQYSSRELVTQRKFDFQPDCKVQFGTYVQASNDAIVTNTMQLHTHRCVALGTSGN